jgi:hypothetical protein
LGNRAGVVDQIGSEAAISRAAVAETRMPSEAGPGDTTDLALAVAAIAAPPAWGSEEVEASVEEAAVSVVVRWTAQVGTADCAQCWPTVRRSLVLIASGLSGISEQMPQHFSKFLVLFLLAPGPGLGPLPDLGRWGKVKALQRLLTCSFSGKVRFRASLVRFPNC